MSITRPVPTAAGGPLPPGVQILGPVEAHQAAILTHDALALVAELTRQARPELKRLLAARRQAQARFDVGQLPGYPEETAHIRDGDWTIAPLPRDLQDRRVEITGPVTRKMVINALNSGANLFMADFEDSSAPTWAQMVEGQVNLRDAVRRTIQYTDPRSAKDYRLRDETATLLVRPRGWHLSEKHLLVDEEPVPAGVFDLGLFLFHNAAELVARGSGPYVYLPKLEHYREASLWNALFVTAQQRLGLPVGTIKATVLIETLPAAFQMDEILHALGPHAAGLNCGRWDYIFSYIKVFRAHPDRVLPDRGQVGMTQPFMRAYTQRLIQVCHRRGALAMGGMAAQIPNKADRGANRAAMEAVRVDKEREANDGHDGTWVAHPGLVELAREAFDRVLAGRQNQLHRRRQDLAITEADLLQHPQGQRTLAGLRHSVRVGVLYLEAWLRGVGCVPLFGLMEDAATAEICRAQIWQWARHGTRLDDGTLVDGALVARLVDEEVGPRRGEGRMAEAMDLFVDLSTRQELAPFLTLPAYDLLD